MDSLKRKFVEYASNWKFNKTKEFLSQNKYARTFHALEHQTVYIRTSKQHQVLCVRNNFDHSLASNVLQLRSGSMFPVCIKKSWVWLRLKYANRYKAKQNVYEHATGQHLNHPHYTK